MAARAAFVFLIATTLASCGGDLPGVVSGSGSAPAISPDSSAEDGEDIALPEDEQLFQQGLAAFNEAEGAADAGSTAEAGEKFATAQVSFDRLWSDYPSSGRHDNAGYLRGRCRYELGDYAGAIATLLEMRAAHPDSVFLNDAAYYTGQARFQLGQYQEAIADFEDSITAGPGSVYADNAAYYVGRSYYEAGELANARASLAGFETAYPQSVYLDNARYYLGRSNFDAGLYADALGPFERVLLTAGSIYEDDARFYHGRSFFHLGDYGAAIADFENLLTAFPLSQYADNALLFEIRSFIAQSNCADAGTALARMTAAYPASTLITRAQADFSAGCA